MYGHIQSEYPTREKTKDQPMNVTGLQGSDGVVDTTVVLERPRNCLSSPMYGTWTIVTKKRRQKRDKENDKGKESIRFQEGNLRNGSRFSILGNEEDFDDDRDYRTAIPSNNLKEYIPEITRHVQNSTHRSQP